MSTPHRSETNGIAESAVRRIKEGTSAVLLQSGLHKKWWADSMECYCYLRNIQDLLPDGKTPCERRFGVPFNGPVIPFGATAERMGESLPNHHEDHSAGKGMISVSHYNLVHKFIPLPQAMKVPAAKAAVDKEWINLRKYQQGS